MARACEIVALGIVLAGCSAITGFGDYRFAPAGDARVPADASRDARADGAQPDARGPDGAADVRADDVVGDVVGDVDGGPEPMDAGGADAGAEDAGADGGPEPTDAGGSDAGGEDAGADGGDIDAPFGCTLATCVPTPGLCETATCFGGVCMLGNACGIDQECCSGICMPMGCGCGGAAQPCCAGASCAPGLGCFGSTCIGCGTVSAPCCPPDVCEIGTTCSPGILVCDPCPDGGPC